MDVDVSELLAWERDVGKVADEFTEELPAVLRKAGVNIKRDWSRAWSGHPKLKRLPRAITFDVKVKATGGTLEVGPELGKRQGPLGGVAAYGTPTSAPIPGPQRALDAEVPRIEDQLARLLAKGLDGG